LLFAGKIKILKTLRLIIFFLMKCIGRIAKGDHVYLFKDDEAIQSFFARENVTRSHHDHLNESGICCGAMHRNAEICDSIDAVIYDRIYGELKNRSR
jgi:hypothetical protein